MADPHKNFAYTTLNATLNSGDATMTVTSATPFPTASTANTSTYYNCTIWPASTQPTAANAEIVRVTNVSGTTFSITRGQEGTSAKGFSSGDQVAATITAKTLTDIEANYINSWSPAIAVSAGTGLQTIIGNSSSSGTNSLYVFPMTVPFPLKFNQMIMAHSFNFTITTATQTASNTHYSLFGLYSMTSNSMSLITSNSFSIGETYTQNSNTSGNLSWNFPTTTATSGYGYGNFAAGALGTGATGSYVGGVRAIGLQFGTEMSISAGMYWLGLLYYRSTSGGTSGNGMSHAGIIGQIINPINMAGTVSGIHPLGMAQAEFAQSNVRISGWNGRFIMGFVTNTAQAGFGGTAIPSVIELANFQTANTTATILPLVSFVST